MEKSSGQHVRVCVRERERGKEIANEKERWLHSELVYEIGDGRYDNVLQKPILSLRVAATTAAHFISFINRTQRNHFAGKHHLDSLKPFSSSGLPFFFPFLPFWPKNLFLQFFVISLVLDI